MENRFDKCKYCKNYDHAQRNAYLPYKCQLDKWDCFDIYEMPRYDEVNDKAYRDQELEEFRKFQEERSKKSNRNYYTLMGFYNFFIFLMVAQAIVVLYLFIVDLGYWFEHDYLTKMQLIKALWNLHPIAYGYIAAVFVLELIISFVLRK